MQAPAGEIWPGLLFGGNRVSDQERYGGMISNIVLILALIFCVLSFIWHQFPLVQVALLLVILSLLVPGLK